MSQTSKLDPVYDSDEVATRYRVSIHTLNKWATSGTGPRYMRAGRHRRYLESELLAWEQRQLVEDPRRSA